MKHIITIAFLLLSSTIFGQKNNFFEQNISLFEDALELYEQKKYAVAQELFEEFIDHTENEKSSYRIKAEFYKILCAINLYNQDAEYYVYNFIHNYPENPHVNEAKFELGNFFFQQKDYDKVIEWYEQLNEHDLNMDKKAEYYFKIGYSHYMEENIEKARVAFYEIIEIDTKYTSPAIYYYSHIHYDLENYQTALRGFLKLTDDESFGNIVPYYITQLYFIQNKYQEIVDFAPSLMENVIDSRRSEVARIIGESYFRIDKYKKALEYLDIYFSESNTTTASDKYILAYCYYATGRSDKAIPLFERITNTKGKVSQNAHYVLADCYLQNGNKDKARMAFRKASEMDYDPKIKEDALFNYAKVTYSLSYSPFNEAINAFEKYLELYPASPKKDEVYNFLVKAYMTTRNYKMALASLDKITIKNEDTEEAYQHVAFYRGLELFNNLRFKEAIDMLDKSMKYGDYNFILNARAHYWKAEALYRQNDYQEAITNYNQFLFMIGSYRLSEYNMAHYNLGYCYFKLKDYKNANTWFRKYVNLANEDISNYLADAYNRIGDCYFIEKSYWPSLENYQKTVELNIFDVDYALYQQALAYGVVDRQNKKIDALNNLLTAYPNSAFIDDGLYELGRTYFAMQRPQKATPYYQRILDEFSNSSYIKKALTQLGLIYYNNDKNELALQHYKRTVAEYSGTDEAQSALVGIKNIYVDQNNVDAYFDFIADLGNYTSVSKSEEDSLRFKAAENLYMNGQCKKAIPSFKRYVNEFSDGFFITTVNFYMADCYMQQNKPDSALKAFKFVIDKSPNSFTEEALAQAARINFKNKNFKEALDHYSQLELNAELKNNILEARIGLMRANFNLENYTETIVAGKKLLSTEKVAEEIERETHYKMAVSHEQLGNLTSALNEYNTVAQEVSSIEGAQSKYKVAQLLFNQQKTDEAEEEIYDFIDMNTPHQYWMAKSFLILARIFVEKEDYFQASHTLQSIIDAYDDPDDGIIKEAMKLKEKVVEIENRANQSPVLQDIEIEMNEDQ